MLPKTNFVLASGKCNTLPISNKFVFLLALLYRENYYVTKKLILYIEIIKFPAQYFKIAIIYKTQRNENTKVIPFCSDKIITLARSGFFVSRQLSFQMCTFRTFA